MIENGEKETHFGDIGIGDDKREKQSNQEMNKWTNLSEVLNVFWEAQKWRHFFHLYAK